MWPLVLVLLVFQVTAPLGSSLLVGPRMAAVVAAPKEAKKPELKGKILGIGGILFKSADAKQAREWYGKHLGLADKGEGAILPWLDKGEPHTERMTVWGVFPATTKYFDPGKGSFMVNYIVDDLDALLERLKGEGVKIDPKRQNEAYGRFAWIYDPDGNKIELWQPPAHK